eukprot:CAMPEP_0177623476 /NCGR_PEP_ID=MMETSP0419_2-20121207/28924_1 /TAXON_ID=582737 /ORGANISM="Tetraselmis sp., Strain GSL018" /LENGTH=330 /DNA_ID=CAMNT_0019124033 /DNA_START=232 /DNA_END=1222 /DNA_ORIENTATION=+
MTTYSDFEVSELAREILAAHPADFYARLLLPYCAGERATRAQFIKLAKILHPDKFSKPLAFAAFSAVTDAWRALKSKENVAWLCCCVDRAVSELTGWRHVEELALIGDFSSLNKNASGFRASLNLRATNWNSLSPQQVTGDALSSAASTLKVRRRLHALLLESESKAQRYQTKANAALFPASRRSHGEAVTAKRGPGKKGMARRARKAKDGDCCGFVKPSDPSVPTRHLHVSNTGPRLGASPEALQAGLDALGLTGAVLSIPRGGRQPFVYLSFPSEEAAASARQKLDRRSPVSRPFLGRVVQADYAEPVLAVALPRETDASALQALRRL